MLPDIFYLGGSFALYNSSDNTFTDFNSDMIDKLWGNIMRRK
jgi:hypothetical protein